MQGDCHPRGPLSSPNHSPERETRYERESGTEELHGPDETRAFGHGALDLLQIGGAEIGRLTLQPGWRWSEHVKPLTGTDWYGASNYARG